jgi:hypothetical protein
MVWVVGWGGEGFLAAHPVNREQITTRRIKREAILNFPVLIISSTPSIKNSRKSDYRLNASESVSEPVSVFL